MRPAAFATRQARPRGRPPQAREATKARDWGLVFEAHSKRLMVEISLPRLVYFVAMFIKEEPGPLIKPRLRRKLSPRFSRLAAPLHPKPVHIRVMHGKDRIESG